MKKILSKNDILGIKDLPTTEVDVPEWGGTVLVRGLTGKERDELELSIIEINGKKQTLKLQNFRAKLCAYAIVDENGNRVFSLEDIEELGKKSANALSRIAEKVQKLSGLTQEEVKRIEDSFLADRKENSISS